MNDSTRNFRSTQPVFDEEAEALELAAYFHEQDPVDIAASDWHTRWEQGLTAAEQGEMQQWLAASTLHAAAYARLDQSVSGLRDLASHLRNTSQTRAGQFARQAPLTRHPQIGRLSEPRAFWRRLFDQPAWAGLSAAVLLVIAMGGYLFYDPATYTSTLSAARGQLLDKTLPDGSTLVMDADTRLEVKLYADRREVHVTNGQIMLAVAPDSAKPFHVIAGPARVTVVGTKFSVRFRPSSSTLDVVNVAVEEGRVHVAGSGANDAYADLVAGQSIGVSSAGQIGSIAAIAPASIAPWRKGMVRFENTTLSDALLELEHYGPTRLVIRDPLVASMHIAGSYLSGQPTAFARMLPEILPVRLVSDNEGNTEIRAR